MSFFYLINNFSLLSYLTISLDLFLWIDANIITLPPFLSKILSNVLPTISKSCGEFYNSNALFVYISVAKFST